MGLKIFPLYIYNITCLLKKVKVKEIVKKVKVKEIVKKVKVKEIVKK